MPGLGWSVLPSLGWLIAPLFNRDLVMVTVRGMSMYPTYQDGDQVLIHRRRTPTTGSIVVVERPKLARGWSGPPVPAGARPSALSGRAWIVKRVAAAPGDPVPRDGFPALAEVPERLVPPSCLVLLGDNREVSIDSRYYGYLPVDRVLGVLLRPWPVPTRRP
jgi:signal peptidase I